MALKCWYACHIVVPVAMRQILNDGKPRRIKSARSYGFVLEKDTTKFGAYEKGGIVTEVKQPKVLQFKPLKEALKDSGEFPFSDTRSLIAFHCYTWHFMF